jgi:hypothetical protein
MHIWQQKMCYYERGRFRSYPQATTFHSPVLVIWNKSRDSSVGIALRCGLDDRISRVRFLTGAGNFSPHYHVQNGSGAHPASYPMGTMGSFPGGEAAWA